jgi:hypothetical protein
VALSDLQLRRIAKGLGLSGDGVASGEQPLIIQALCALPLERRADAIQVVQLRFAAKLDVESIARECGLDAWEVWQLEASFLKELEALSSSVRQTAAQATV